jgi:hypothetical protein
MAITLNLLAEHQFAEEIKRRDPVRRTIVGSVIVLLLALGAVVVLSLYCWVADEEKKAVESHWQSLERQNKQLTDDLTKNRQIDKRLYALRTLASNRFLWGPVLNSLQDCVVDRVQVTGIRAEQTCSLLKIPPSKDSKSKTIITNAVEKIVLNIEARDYANGQFSRFQDSLSSHTYLHRLLTNGTVRLTNLNPPVKSDGESAGRDFTIFRIEVAFPPITRESPK